MLIAVLFVRTKSETAKCLIMDNNGHSEIKFDMKIQRDCAAIKNCLINSNLLPWKELINIIELMKVNYMKIQSDLCSILHDDCPNGSV